ncbi:carbohydrate ABC transporter permease [Paenibacillus eucommiae]|uniref:ABC-type glycerol-3-phosphate transport system permease component n=1 Tax=Paenibacillus eucommiae TaxID=1355755 RepID=A0ABS4IUA0_9BACL|nr:carbohydrate ABC transporter permease [Paenibacillus eucommiae]MBP1990149.1 ABC-type glycerol-3-phosphate transport system permease component [Paenibacillus eucommiae]
MKTNENTIVDWIWRIVLFGWALTIIVPLLWVIYESLKTNQEFFADVWALPKIWAWENYKNAWVSYELGSTMLNTLYYVGVSLLLGTFLTTINAYALVRLQFSGRKLIWSMIMLSLFLPGINALVPQYILMRDLHLLNSLTGLIILDSLGESVFFLMLLGGFMQSLPKELEESAYMDGASLFQTFLKIIVPLSMPGIVTVAIFKFLGLYNNFLGPFIYLSDASKHTIGVKMYHANQIMQYKSDMVTLFAGVTIAMLPTLIIYILFQRKIVEGATLGAVKG